MYLIIQSSKSNTQIVFNVFGTEKNNSFLSKLLLSF